MITPLHIKSRTGMAMIEVLIGILILSFGLIPIYSLFTSSKKIAFKSELSYLALHAARDRLDEVQLMPLSALITLAKENEAGEPNWVSCSGNVFSSLLTATKNVKDPAPMDGSTPTVGNETALAGDKYNYPDSYERIKLKTAVTLLKTYPESSQSETPSQWQPHLFKVVVKVRWQEKGEDVQAEEEKKSKIFKSHFERLFSVGGSAERDL